MLGVSIPANAAIWLVHDGQSQVRRLLTNIGPADLKITDRRADLSATSFALQLWRLVRTHRWPEGKAASGLGRTKASKLLATKRPNLIPVYDKHVGDALLRSHDDNDWILWQRRLTGDDGNDLTRALTTLRSEGHIPAGISDLRILDIVIWMRVHGYKFTKALVDFEDAPNFWAGAAAN